MDWQEPVKDKLEPVVFSLNMSLHEQEPEDGSSLQNLDSFPILSQGQKLTQKIEVQRGGNLTLFRPFILNICPLRYC